MSINLGTRMCIIQKMEWITQKSTSKFVAIARKTFPGCIIRWGNNEKRVIYK